jgi:DNA-binding MarR family transcriptional regulator
MADDRRAPAKADAMKPKRRGPSNPRPARSRTPRRAPASDTGYRLEEQVGHLLRRAHQRHTALFARHIGAAALTPTQWAALFTLRGLGAASQNQLGRRTAIDAATVQDLVRRLIRHGLVAQRRDAADRRRNVLRLTPAGAALVAECIASARHITRLTLAPLAADERKTLVRLLRRLT